MDIIFPPCPLFVLLSFSYFFSCHFCIIASCKPSPCKTGCISHMCWKCSPTPSESTVTEHFRENIRNIGFLAFWFIHSNGSWFLLSLLLLLFLIYGFNQLYPLSAGIDELFLWLWTSDFREDEKLDTKEIMFIRVFIIPHAKIIISVSFHSISKLPSKPSIRVCALAIDGQHFLGPGPCALR